MDIYIYDKQEGVYLIKIQNHQIRLEKEREKRKDH